MATTAVEVWMFVFYFSKLWFDSIFWSSIFSAVLQKTTYSETIILIILMGREQHYLCFLNSYGCVAVHIHTLPALNLITLTEKTAIYKVTVDSSSKILSSGVTQGLVLGPILFIFYIISLETQIYGSFSGA